MNFQQRGLIMRMCGLLAFTLKTLVETTLVVAVTAMQSWTITKGTTMIPGTTRTHVNTEIIGTLLRISGSTAISNGNVSGSVNALRQIVADGAHLISAAP